MNNTETIIVEKETSAIIADAIRRMADASEQNALRLAQQEQRMIKTEVVQEQLTAAVNKMASSSDRMILTIEKLVVDNSKFEQQIIGLEDRALNRINNAVDDIRAIKTDFTNMQGRVYLLELESAGNAGREQEISNQRKWWNDNWHKLLTVFIMVIPVVVAIYTLVKK